MLCLSDHQTMILKDQSTIPKATFIEIGVYVTVTAKGPGFYRRHHHGNSNITVQDWHLTTWPLSHAFFFHANYLFTKQDQHFTTWPPSHSLLPLKDLNLVPKMLLGPAIINQLNHITIIIWIVPLWNWIDFYCVARCANNSNIWKEFEQIKCLKGSQISNRT